MLNAHDLSRLEAECSIDTSPPGASGFGTITIDKQDLREILQRLTAAELRAIAPLPSWRELTERIYAAPPPKYPPSGRQRTVALCPVCTGTGSKHKSFYEGGFLSTLVECRACTGRGVIIA